jgi:hypothetical protein
MAPVMQSANADSTAHVVVHLPPARLKLIANPVPFAESGNVEPDLRLVRLPAPACGHRKSPRNNIP